MYRSILYIVLIFCAGIFSACDKKLSEPPANARVDVNAVTDQKTANTALNGAYYRFANVTSNNVANWENHQLPGAVLTGMLGYGLGPGQDEDNINAASTYVPPLWNQSYLLLNAANGVIEGVNKVADAAFINGRKEEILGEGRFLRAYGHSKLLIYFAEWNNANSSNGVLLRDKFVTLSSISQKRSTVAASYDFILQDLDYAIAHAPAANQKYYATRWAAMLLKMRILMTRGQSGDYTQVLQLADSILQHGPYTLESNLKDIFYVKGLNSSEVILGVKPQANQESYPYALSKAYYPAASAFYVAKKGLMDLLQNDPRGSWMIGPLTPYQLFSPDTWYFTKYIAFGGEASQLTETSYAMRLSEVYLTKAEALVRSGGSLTDAKGLIKTVMAKAGVTDFTAVDNAATANEVRKQIYYEVLRNLTGEDGIEALFLMRLPFDMVKQLRPTITTTVQFYFPVPTTENNMNPLFGQQNTGYGW